VAPKSDEVQRSPEMTTAARRLPSALEAIEFQY
jgi:hypothetical protein